MTTTFTPVTVTIDGTVFGDGTPDGDGILYDWQALDGWFDTADVRVAQGEVQPMGMGITVARRNARPIAATLLAHHQSGRALNDLMFSADITVKDACDALTTPVLLEVDDPYIGDTLQSYVRSTGPIRRKMIGTRNMVQYLVPLLAPDPRRYSGTETDTDLTITGTGTNTTAVIANVGDDFTPFTFTVEGPALNPQIINETLADTPTVIYGGTVDPGDELIFDMQARTVTYNGIDDRSTLTTAQWWQLAPGGQSVRYRRTSGASTSVATLTHRDAYR